VNGSESGCGCGCGCGYRRLALTLLMKRASTDGMWRLGGSKTFSQAEFQVRPGQGFSGTATIEILAEGRLLLFFPFSLCW